MYIHIYIYVYLSNRRSKMSAVYHPWGDNQRTHTYIKISYMPKCTSRNRLVRVPEPTVHRARLEAKFGVSLGPLTRGSIQFHDPSHSKSA